MGKEILKILGMAIGLSSCNDPGCIMVYHRSVQDVDRNQRVCERCRKEFVEGIGRVTGRG
jgi:predicted Zn-dependent protease